jgi:hypothetical protein
MTAFNDLTQLADAHGLEVRTQPLDDGRMGVTVTMNDDPTPVCGLACAVAGTDNLDAAARALIPAISATFDHTAATADAGVHEATKLVAVSCGRCHAPFIYASHGQAATSVRCPDCSAAERLTERLSVALSLSLVQSNVDDIAAGAPLNTAVELVPVLAELARLGAALAPTISG